MWPAVSRMPAPTGTPEMQPFTCVHDNMVLSKWGGCLQGPAQGDARVFVPVQAFVKGALLRLAASEVPAGQLPSHSLWIPAGRRTGSVGERKQAKQLRNPLYQ